MALRHYEIANLVHHFLVKEGYDSVAELFVSTCSHLSGLKSLNNSHQGAKKLPRLFGPSLIDLYEEYLDSKDQLIDELEQLDCVDFRPQDSLPTLLKTLVHQLKQKSKNASTTVPKQTNDASVNTEAEIVSDPSSTQSTPSVSETIQSNDEDVLEAVDDVLGAMYDRMLEDTELHVKLAESINKNIFNHLNQSKISSDPLLSSTSSHKLDPMMVKAVVEETQADPLFDSIVHEFLGKEEESFPPDSLFAHCENVEGTDAASVVPYPLTSGTDSLCQQVSPSKNHSGHSSLTESQVIISPSKANITVNSYAIVTAANGQVTMIPSILSAIPAIAITPTPTVSKPKRQPVAIAPKPPTPIMQQCAPASEKSTPETKTCLPASNLSELSAKVDSAVKEAIGDFDQEISLIPCDPNQPPIKVRISAGRHVEFVPSSPSAQQPISVHSSPVKEKSPNLPAEAVPEVKKESKKSTKQGKSHTKLQEAVPEKRQSIANSHSHVLLSRLVKLASEAAEKSADRSTVAETTPVPATAESSANEVPNCTPALQTVPQPVLSTPSSAGRNRSHVRALFTSSPDPDNDSHIGTLPASASTPAPWDSCLRSKVSASGPSDSQIFSTPKGKAKKARKSSPHKNPNASKTKANDEAANVSQSAPPAETAADAPVETSVNETSMEIDCTANTSAVEMTVIESQNKADTSLTTVTVTVDPESVTAQLLSEIVNSPTKESNAAFQLSSSAGHPVANPAGPSINQPLMNSLFTPQKPLERTVLTYDGTMSSAFGWDGEVPCTPQIKMEGNSSSSPFLVSLTKGFQFLPAAESPSLAGTPLTPSILNYGQSSSVETPFASLNRIGILSTPRLEALRNEIMESPGKDASNTMISPTQFVLGRSTPYFVPSGERSRGPFQQIATPEHQTEERTRRIPCELVGPLRLEDAIDSSSLQDGSSKSTSAQLASTAPANQVVNGKEFDKSKTTADGKLDVLVNECERPDKSQKSAAPASSTLVAVDSQKPTLREKLVELFGEDSTLSLITAPSPAKFASHVEPRQETAFQKNPNVAPKNPGTLTGRQPKDKALSAWWQNGKLAAAGTTSEKPETNVEETADIPLLDASTQKCSSPNPAAPGTTSEQPEETIVEETADSLLLDASTQKRSSPNPAAPETTSEQPEETIVEETADSPLLGARKQKRSKPLLEEEDGMASDGGDNEAVIQELMSLATKAAKINSTSLSSKRKPRTNNTRKKRTSLPNNIAEAAEVCAEEKQRSRSYSKTRRSSVSAETQPESPQPEQQPVVGPQKRKSRSASRSSLAPTETDPPVTETEPKRRRSRRLSTTEQLATGTEKSDAPEITATSEEVSKKTRSRRKSVTKTDEVSADPEPVETDARLPEIAKVKRKSRVSVPGTSATANDLPAVLPRNKRQSASPKLISSSPSKEKVENRKQVPEKGVRKLSFDSVTQSRKSRISLRNKSSPERVTSSKLRGSPTKVAGRVFRSPPKLFKAIPPPYGRKAVSFRQSAGGSAKNFNVEPNWCVENNNNNPGKEVSDVENQVPASENAQNDVENQMAELHGELNQQSSLNTSDKDNSDDTISNKERSTTAEGAVVQKPDFGIEDESLNFDAILSDIAATDDVETDSISQPRTLSAKSDVNDVVVRPEESSPPHTSTGDAGKSIPAEVVLEKSTEADEGSNKSSNGPGTKSCDDVQLEKLPIRKSPRKRANAEVCSDPVDVEDGKKKPTSQSGQSKSNRSSGKLGNYLEMMSFVDNQKKQPTHLADQVPAAAATSETRQTDSTSNFEAKIVMTGLVQRLQKRLVVNHSDLYSQ